MIDELVARMENGGRRHWSTKPRARYRDQIVEPAPGAGAAVHQRRERGRRRDRRRASANGIGVVQMFVVRNGQSLGSKTMHAQRHVAGATAKEILRGFPAAILPESPVRQPS